ncbi:MAG: hypothetical protein J3K34DRAFT_439860 [Monoraphidium minutum]|nr:MAG: hypothetical protein J3K34DRAFT_439860 [Monoraphidium minutum]
MRGCACARAEDSQVLRPRCPGRRRGARRCWAGPAPASRVEGTHQGRYHPIRPGTGFWASRGRISGGPRAAQGLEQRFCASAGARGGHAAATGAARRGARARRVRQQRRPTPVQDCPRSAPRNAQFIRNACSYLRPAAPGGARRRHLARGGGGAARGAVGAARAAALRLPYSTLSMASVCAMAGHPPGGVAASKLSRDCKGCARFVQVGGGFCGETWRGPLGARRQPSGASQRRAGRMRAGGRATRAGARGTVLRLEL